MADRPHRGAGHVAVWLDRGTVIVIQAAILGFRYGDAVPARSPVAPPISQIMNGLIDALIKRTLDPFEPARTKLKLAPRFLVRSTPQPRCVVDRVRA